MSDPKDQSEPTMEEILASIRRIISEDGEEAGNEGAEAVAEPEAAAEPDPEPEPEAAEEPDTEPEPEPDPEPEIEPEPEPEMEEEAEDDILELSDVAEEEPEPEPAEAAEPSPPAAPPDTLVSDATEQLAGASFAELSAVMVAGYEGDGNTLEALVREMLKPMLKAYLDQNLPRIVEDMVEREVARISRKK